MGNVSYALKMAAGMLLAIILVSLISLMLSNFARFGEEELIEKREKQTLKYNEMYTAYEKSQMYGTDIISLLNLAYNENLQNKVWNKNASGVSESSAENTDYRIEIEVRLKTPLESNLRLYFFDPKVGEKMAGIEDSNLKSNKTIEDVFLKLKEGQELLEKFNKDFKSVGIDENTNIKTIGNNVNVQNNSVGTKIFMNKNINTKTLEILQDFSKFQKVVLKNKEFDLKTNNWTTLEWKTYTSDMKLRNFKFLEKEINKNTGRISKMIFQEI